MRTEGSGVTSRPGWDLVGPGQSKGDLGETSVSHRVQAGEPRAGAEVIDYRYSYEYTPRKKKKKTEYHREVTHLLLN